MPPVGLESAMRAAADPRLRLRGHRDRLERFIVMVVLLQLHGLSETSSESKTLIQTLSARHTQYMLQMFE